MIQEDKASILDIKLDHELTEPPAAFALLAHRFERLPKDERLLTSSELAAGPSLSSGPLDISLGRWIPSYHFRVT
jgi:hypothetical protein